MNGSNRHKTEQLPAISPRIRELLGNFALAGGTLVIALLALDFAMFRYTLVPDDGLRSVTINQVVRYQPNSEARLCHHDGSSSRAKGHKAEVFQHGIG